MSLNRSHRIPITRANILLALCRWSSIFLAAILLQLTASPTTAVQLEIKHYYQRDKDWNEKPLGLALGGETIGDYGCGVASGVMVLDSYGIKMTPLELNEALVRNGGFSGAYLLWGINPEAWKRSTGGKILGMTDCRSSYGDCWKDREKTIHDSVQIGRPVIVYLNSSHYVVITRYDTNLGKFFINDPAKIEAEGKDIEFDKNVLGLPFSQITQFVILDPDPKSVPSVEEQSSISREYLTLGGVDGILGIPTQIATQAVLPNATQSIVQEFEKGTIYSLSRSDGNWNTYWLPTDLAQVYQKQGGPSGALGLPTSDVYPFIFNFTLYGARADFERGSLIRYPSDAQPTVYTGENAFKAEYFAGTELKGSPLAVRYEPQIIFDWGLNAPDPRVPPDNFSAQWTGKIDLGLPGPEDFYVWADNGVRLILDDKDILINSWQTQPDTKHTARRLFESGGVHRVTLEYFHGKGNARIIFVTVAPPATPVFAAEQTVGSFDVLPKKAPPLRNVPQPQPRLDTIVDELQPQFTRSGTPKNWKESIDGYGGHSYWTLNNNKIADNIGTWKMSVDKPGSYEIFVYIPSEHSTTTNTIYQVKHAGETARLSVNQAAHHNEWYSLGTFPFDGKSEEYVRLTDVSDEQAGKAEIAFDAIGYVYHEPAFWESWSTDIQEWFAKQIAELQRNFEQWAREQQENFIRQLQADFTRWLEQQCKSTALVLLIPVSAYTLSRKYRNRN